MWVDSVDIRAYLNEHPDASASEIALHYGANSADVLMVLKRLESQGVVQRSREGTKAWRWELTGAAP